MVAVLLTWPLLSLVLVLIWMRSGSASAQEYEDKVEADIQKAKSYGVNGTPATFVVDNHTGKSQLLGGAQPAQAIMAVMRK